MLGFEFALEKQRREQRRLDYHTRTTLPKWLTYSKLERHACEIYTRSVFFEVQTRYTGLSGHVQLRVSIQMRKLKHI
ncbi:hypothetical protein Ccrd_010228 [Cynara cardunculus var. scolymus]|uniref:Uncharacterized protein n=1 Tax=Cynara cardunculus var. scolymus TaxID=59895 RepID=A0A103YLQ0_CYNCS|nr:hypothetical protein Ccrd_010228 [Cynara cardunculus var. scolymus]